MSNKAKNPDLPTGRSGPNRSTPKPKKYLPGDLPRAVVVMLREGNHAAYEHVYNAYNKDVKHFLISLTRSEQTAEDILQEAFLYLWEKREGIDPDKSIVGYLFHIVRNKVLMRLRRTQMEERYLAELDNDEIGNTSADSAMIREQTEILLRMIIEHMPRQRRRIYEMSRFEGKSNEEIAKELGIDPGNVRVQLHYALKEIRDKLGIFLLFFLI